MKKIFLRVLIIFPGISGNPACKKFIRPKRSADSLISTASKWRTELTWGIGLTSDAQGGLLYLIHDGRDRNFEEVKHWFGGEDEESKRNYTKLSPKQQEKIHLFLPSL
jgi:CxxC motif-containing protein (DUF1111 family)